VRYIVTAARPSNCNGSRSVFRKGDIVEIRDRDEPDSDGDYMATRVSDGEADYIYRGDVSPESVSGSLSVDAVKAALLVKGVDDPDAILRLASAIEGAL
jgi:hypothetical protein